MTITQSDIDSAHPTFGTPKRTALLSRYTSRRNKIHLAIGWAHFHGLHIEYRWSGAPYRSRLQFQFEQDGAWFTAESYEDDIAPTLKLEKPRNEVGEL